MNLPDVDALLARLSIRLESIEGASAEALLETAAEVVRAGGDEVTLVAQRKGHFSKPSEGRRWLLGLSGASNFTRRSPFYAVCGALFSGGNVEAVFGLSPGLAQRWAAVAGEGLWENGVPSTTLTSPETLKLCCCRPRFPEWLSSRGDLVGWFLMVAGSTAGVWFTGSPAIELFSLATGRLDAFTDWELSVVEKACGMLAAREAGMTMSDLSGAPAQLSNGGLMVAARAVWGEWAGTWVPFWAEVAKATPNGQIPGRGEFFL